MQSQWPVAALRQVSWLATAGLVTCIAVCGDVLAADSDELDDAAARAQYAFYTADVRSLEEVMRLLERLQVPADQAALKQYYSAYGYWKLSQLHAARTSEQTRTTRSPAARAAQACVRAAALALKLEPRMAEAHALDAACAGPSLATPCTRTRSLRSARDMEPENPRIQLIEALCDSGAQADPQRPDQLRKLVAAFEAAPPARSGRPDWGLAEALVLLGDSYIHTGDSMAARDAIERALVIAPDYRRAQSLLESATRRTRQ